MRYPSFTAAALMAAVTAGPLFAGEISPDLRDLLRTEGEAEVIVYFEDQAPLTVTGRQNQEQVLRRLRENLSYTEQLLERELGFAADGELVRSKNWITNSVSMTLDAAQVERVAEHPAVKRVLWDAPVSAPDATVDPSAKPEEGEYTYGLDILEVDQVREVFGFTGRGVKVGNIDTGADGNHPDLEGRIKLYKDLSGETDFPTDTHGHGTHTAATMVGGNASGTHIGVAPDAELYVARGIAGSSVLTNLLNSMEWMLDPDEDPSTDDAPVVVSMSWHSGGGDQQPFYEALAAMEAAGVIPNFSAGNSGSSGLTHPKEYPGTVTTAATDSNDDIASFSSRGPAYYQGEEQQKPEWAAPGVDVYSAKPGGGYQTMSGTSMAAPHGAGVIALLFEADPTLSPAQVREILQSTSDDLGPEGWDTAFGAGRLNAFDAVSLVAKGGKLMGKVTDADGNPVSIARLRIVERDFSVAVAEDGGFSLRLPEGSYTLEVSAFAYVARTESVTVNEGDEITLDVTLENAETVEATGRVTAQETGAGVAARVAVLGTPLAAQETDAEGNFGFSLPAGTYTFQVTSFGYQVASQEVTVPADPIEFALEPLPPILVVDDDKGKSYEAFYQGALDSLGKEYGVLADAGSMDDQTLLPYRYVVWFTGDDYGDTLTSSDIERLGAFLENGGKLILSGQDLGYALKNNAFYTGTLKAKYVKDTAGSKQVGGLGLSFAIEGGDGAGNQKYPDVISAEDGAELVFHYGDDTGAGLRVGDSIAYLSFGLEGVDTADNRAALLGKLFEMLEGGDAASVDTTSAASRSGERMELFETLFQ